MNILERGELVEGALLKEFGAREVSEHGVSGSSTRSCDLQTGRLYGTMSQSGSDVSVMLVAPRWPPGFNSSLFLNVGGNTGHLSMRCGVTPLKLW